MRKLFFSTVIILLCTSAVLLTACAAMIEASNPKKNPSESIDATPHEWWLQSVRAADGGSMLYPDRFANQYICIIVSPKGTIDDNVHKYNRPRCGNEMSLSELDIDTKRASNISQGERTNDREKMAIEAALRKTLTIADSYEISGGILRLKYKGSVLATFTSYR